MLQTISVFFLTQIIIFYIIINIVAITLNFRINGFNLTLKYLRTINYQIWHAINVNFTRSLEERRLPDPDVWRTMFSKWRRKQVLIKYCECLYV
jgi:hypothetical protein